MAHLRVTLHTLDFPCPASVSSNVAAKLTMILRRGRLISGRCRASSIVGLLAVLISPTEAQVCTGDCNADGNVTVDEIIRGVDIALGVLQLTDCPNFDRDDNGKVTIDEVITAVDVALQGCPAAPTF